MDAPVGEGDRAVWAVPAETVAARLGTDACGLSPAEAAARLARFGPNRLPEAEGRSALERFLAQFHNVLIYVLLFASVLTAFLGHWIDTAVIVGVVLVNAAIGYVQEGKAEQAIEAVRNMLSLQATAVRAGRRQVIPAEELVPGDVVVLQSGDKVPADLRLLRVKGLQVEEAALTGESLPVTKSPEPVPADAPLGDRTGMAFSGTLVTYGQATGIVVATGAATEIGRISTMLAQVRTLTTPLLRQMGVFGRWLTLAIVAVALATFAVGFLQGSPASEMLLAAVGLAVAAIPEGLPAIVTITLALGVQAMAKRSAIIRRLPAVETLGSVSTICSDKTGTLTRNELTARTVVTAAGAYELAGIGYEPRGAVLRDGAEIDPDGAPVLVQALRSALLCNDAVVREADGAWRVEGDPTEGALLVAAQKAGLDPAEEARLRPRTDEIPFEAEHRFMATLHHDHAGSGAVHLKGAPERVLEMCRCEADGRPLDRDAWTRRAHDLAASGQRVLAVATKAMPAGQTTLAFADVEGDLTLLGLFGLIDPPREEAVEAVRECHAAGIAVKMITGDHAATASAIAAELGLRRPAEVLTGRDLDGMSEAELAEKVLGTNVFARTSPEHKLRLVEALQAHGQVVAMTGDGVNDAPALKRADIGIAMGINGTEAAKEAAEMVLADDNFASIVRAVREGRTVYDNLKKTILFMLPTNGGQALTVVAAVLAAHVLPITPVQILWVNLVTAVTLALALAFERPERDVMRRPPRPADEPILSGMLAWRVVFVSLLMLVATFGLFTWTLADGAELAEARTVAVNALIACQVFYLFGARFLLAPSLTPAGLFGSPPVLIAVGLIVVFQLLFTYAPPLQLLFGTAPLALATWGPILAAGVAVLLLVELEKAAFRTRRRRAGKEPAVRRGGSGP
ncbi:MAG TPA: cation-transporting P-type ATPase [Beijerinckiaceae bacterium]|nr:cation-transporting P-type ATPase [Beijerinckiaceae bacterium]